MSNFMRAGKRLHDNKKSKETKQHVKAFYKIINTINTEVIPKLDLSVDYTEENIDEYVNPILGRDLDSMEKFMILGKLEMNKNQIN